MEETVFICCKGCHFEGHDICRIVTSKAVATQWKEEQERHIDDRFEYVFIREMPIKNCAFDKIN